MYECQDSEITSFMPSRTPSLGGGSDPERFIHDGGVCSSSSAEKSYIFEKVMPEVILQLSEVVLYIILPYPQILC